MTTTTPTNFRTNPEQLKRAHRARYVLPAERPTDYKRAGKSKIANLQLPQDVTNLLRDLSSSNKTMRNDYIVALHEAGWTNSAIARGADISPQMIRNIILGRTASISSSKILPMTCRIPEVPKHPEKVGDKRYIKPNPELLARLKELQPLAQKVRSSSPLYRAEAEEYSYLISQATAQGVTIYRLAKLLGVTPSALAFRLVRYGYTETTIGKSKAYKKIIDAHRKA